MTMRNQPTVSVQPQRVPSKALGMGVRPVASLWRPRLLNLTECLSSVGGRFYTPTSHRRGRKRQRGRG
jgi:hypothetical protein